jgi:preprotein translocase subunit YajC
LSDPVRGDKIAYVGAPPCAVPANWKVMDVFLAQNEPTGGSALPLLMIVALFAIFYFLLIRPQQKRRREATQMQSELAVGDEVVTVGGLHGTIAELDDQTVILETSEGIFSRYERGAIGRRVTVADESADTDAGSGSGSVREQRDKD